MALFKTQNDLKSNTKTTVIELLNQLLADGIDLALLTKQAHWNLKGPQFSAIQ
jgi:starvation-inducible DNA-binding protein